MGLAILLNGRPTGAITTETVEIVVPGGHTLRAWRMGQQARREAVVAWLFPSDGSAARGQGALG